MVGLEQEELNTMIGNGKGATKERGGPPKGPPPGDQSRAGHPRMGDRLR